MNQGISARSVTSVTARVKVDSQAPKPPDRSGSWAIIRCAAFLAVSADPPASYCTNRTFAPPNALMPPAALISSTAISAPDR